MGFVTRILAEVVWYFVGLDLGQSQDHSALAVVERADLILGTGSNSLEAIYLVKSCGSITYETDLVELRYGGVAH